MVLGLLCEQFIRKLGMEKFMICLQYGTNRLLTASPDKKTGLLIENLCLGLLNGQDIADVRINPPKDQAFLLGLALLDLFLGFPTNASAEIFNQSTGASISPVLQAIYFNQFRDKIRTAGQAALTSATGNKWDAATDAICRILGVN